MSVLGGREGLRRSLGSVLSGSVTRFLGGRFRCVSKSVINMYNVKSQGNGIAVSRDGQTLLVTGSFDGSLLQLNRNVAVTPSYPYEWLSRHIGSRGYGAVPYCFQFPWQVWLDDDGFAFVADLHNRHVQVLSPDRSFHSFVGVGQLCGPTGVCASASIVVVVESEAHRVAVFRRSDRTLLYRFGASGRGAGQLLNPRVVSFMSGGAQLAVVEKVGNRVSVFRVDGSFVRHVGAGVLRNPRGVACSAFDELVVADTDNRCLRLFSDAGELLKSFGYGDFRGVAIHGCTVYAQDCDGRRCVVWV
jgi:DNA-binding beta-propeller fold protein YncE